MAVIVGVLAVFGGSQLAAHASHGVHSVHATQAGGNVSITVPPPSATVTVTAPPQASNQIPCQLAATAPGSTPGVLYAKGMNIAGTFESGQLQDETCTVAFAPDPSDPAAADGMQAMTLTDSNGNISQWVVSPAS